MKKLFTLGILLLFFVAFNAQNTGGLAVSEFSIQRDRRYLEEQLSQAVDKERSLSIRMERFQQQLKLYKLFGLDIEKEPLNDSVNKE